MLVQVLKKVLIGYLFVFTISVKLMVFYLYWQQPAQFVYRLETFIYPVFAQIPVKIFGMQQQLAPLPTAAEKAKSDQLLAEEKAATERLADQQLQQEINQQYGRWEPLPADTALSEIELDGVSYPNLAEAVKKIKDNSHLKIPTGVYQQPLFIKHHNVTIEGIGHVVFEKGVSQAKGYILATGNDLTVKNIECRYIKVESKNGVCIRLEGRGLSLEHVYFHSSEGALLETSKEHGFIQINDSRFENLAANARSHSIYLNKASLHLSNSIIIGNRNQHSLKSRGPKTVVEKSIIAELSTTASRLIDISNGGELVVTQSLLHKGPNSVNNQVIGFGLEGIKHPLNKVSISDSVLLLDRANSNYILHSGISNVLTFIHNNVIVASDDIYEGNRNLKSRSDINIGLYPAMPNILCNLQNC